ncbi:MAG: hypothetical protein AAFV07_04910 [Bacteroidota bacterium]
MRRIQLLLWVCMLAGAGCSLQDGTLDPDTVLTLNAGPETVLADGQKRITLTATLGELADPNLSVIFRTDGGRFAGTARQAAQEITVPASQGQATVELISNTAVLDKVVVSAEIQGLTDQSISFKAFDSVRFARAFPEEMLLEADRLSVPADQFQAASLTVSLFRTDGGQVSDGSLIRFSATPVDTSEAVALLPDFIFADQTTATISVKSQTFSAGQVFIKAETETEDGSLLEKTIILTFTE